MSILPWRNKSDEMTKAITTSEDQVVPSAGGDIVVHKGNPLAVGSSNALVQVRPRMLVIAGDKVQVTPQSLIRCIKRVTQNIGEYKDQDDVYAKVVIGALRKARGDLVSLLENEFHIHWQIDKRTGESHFFMD
jgi:hypothetical protein